NENAAFVTLQYEYQKEDKGFPFNYTCTITYSLEKDNSLSIRTSVKNNSETQMPLCDGWHPYFTLGAKVNELSFEMNADKMLVFNERLVPTGEIIPYKKFQQPEILDDTFLDNCFLLNDNNKPAFVLRNNSSGLELSIQPDKSYPYLQIYTPPHRNSIAIENLSAAPDAFNNKIGLAILKPGETCSFKTVYSASIKL
ncbi:MAG: aldose 1-epimerase, partial [Parafilimonas sp.]